MGARRQTVIKYEDIPKIANCKDCPFSKDGKPPHRPVLGEFNTDRPIAILVGEGPGDNEVRENRPFVGATGKELDRELARASIPRSKTVVLNATACKPSQGKTDQTMGRASKCCRPLFLKQLEVCDKQSVAPKLAMGKWAAYAVTGKAQATETSRGFLRENNTLFTYHPTYAFFRNPRVRGDFEIDLVRFRRLIDGKLQTAPRVVINPGIEDLHSLLRHINLNNRTVAVDIETGPEEGDSEGFTGKDPTRATLKTIAFGTDKYACAFRWPITNDLWGIVSAILSDPSITKVLHNGEWFDKRVCKRYGIKIEPTIDTREIRRALVATSGLSLRYLAQTYCDFPDWKSMEKDDEK